MMECLKFIRLEIFKFRAFGYCSFKTSYVFLGLLQIKTSFLFALSLNSSCIFSFIMVRVKIQCFSLIVIFPGFASLMSEIKKSDEFKTLNQRLNYTVKCKIRILKSLDSVILMNLNFSLTVNLLVICLKLID